MQELSSAVPSGASFDTHYYQRLLRGRGLLFADQQLMAHEKIARLVFAYASDLQMTMLACMASLCYHNDGHSLALKL